MTNTGRQGPSLYNEDLPPVPAGRRLAMSVCMIVLIPMLGGRGECAGDPARHSGMRLVRNSDVDRRGIGTIKFLEGTGAPFMLGMGLLLLWWITRKAGGLGPVLSSPSKFKTTAEFMRFLVPSLTGMVGQPIWDPVALLGRFHQPAIATVALAAILFATLNTNIAANVVSPSNDFSNLKARPISFRTGGLITGVDR